MVPSAKPFCSSGSLLQLRSRSFPVVSPSAINERRPRSFTCQAFSRGSGAPGIDTSLPSTSACTAAVAIPVPGSIAMPQPQHRQQHPVGSLLPPHLQQDERTAEKVHTDSSADEADGAYTSASQHLYTLVSPNWKPLVGVSRQHLKVTDQVSKASGSSAPLVITGDAGLNTLKLAATVHAQALESGDVHHPLVVFDCATASGQAGARQLLSGSGSLCSDAALLQKLLKGTLVLNNVHLAPAKLLAAIDGAMSTLSKHAVKTGRPAPPQTQLPSGPGSFLSGLTTRLVVISQRPHVQLLEQMAGAAAAPAAGACSGSCGCRSTDSADGSSGGGCGGARAGAVGCSGRCAPTMTEAAGSKSGPLPDGLAKVAVIAVPALRQRSPDIVPLAIAAGTNVALLRGYGAVSLTPSAAKQLTSYAFPGNEAELKGLVKRAVMLHPLADEGSLSTCPTLTLDADDFWSATQASDRARLDALEVFPWIRTLLLDTGIWPHGLNKITKWLYPLVVAALFLGPQDREHSAALTVFWAGWWPLVFLSFPFVGRAWCAMCPFMITGEGAQHIVNKDKKKAAPAAAAAAAVAGCSGTKAAGAESSSAQPINSTASNPLYQALQQVQQAMSGGWGWQLKKWPAEQLAAWGGWFVAVGFALILVWEDVDNLPNSGVLSGMLLMLITSGAVACSMVYEKRLWCRHLCPVGGMNGLMAKMSMTEIRSRPGICAAAACSRPCHNGREVTQPAAARAAAEPASGFSGQHRLNLSGQAAAKLGLLRPQAAESQPKVKKLPGCPLNTYPGKHQDNKDCINCLNCLSSCASSSAQLRLRPPAADLWSDHSASWHEVSLMYILLGAVALHRLPELCNQVGIPASAVMDDTATHTLAAFALLAAPGAIAYAVDQLAPAVQTVLGRDSATAAAAMAGQPGSQDPSQASTARVSFLRMSYSLVPMIWAGTLAHYEQLTMTELMLAWPRLLGSLAIASEGPDAFWLLNLMPHIAPAPAAVVSAAQGCTLLLGTALSWALAGKIASRDVGPDAAATAAQPQRLLILLAAYEFWQLIV